MRASDVTLGQARTADIQLSRHTDRRRLQLLIEDVHLRVGDGTSDGDLVKPLLDPPDGRPNGGLGRPITIPERSAVLEQLTGQVTIERFAADEHLQGRAGLPSRLDEQPPGRRGRLHHGGLALIELLPEGKRIGRHVVLDQRHARPRHQRQEDLRAQMSNDNVVTLNRTSAGDNPGSRHRPEEIDQRTMRDLHTLRLPSRSRGINDIGAAVGAGCRRRAIFRLPQYCVPLAVQANDFAAKRRQPGDERQWWVISKGAPLSCSTKRRRSRGRAGSRGM